MFRKKGILVLTMAMILASISLTACQKTQETASVSSETSVLSAVSEGQETSVSSAEETASVTEDVSKTTESSQNSVSSTSPVEQSSTAQTSTKPAEQSSTAQTSTKPAEQSSTVQTSTQPAEQSSTVQTSTQPAEQSSTVQTSTKPAEQSSTVQTSTKPVEQSSTVQTSTKPTEQSSTVQTSTKPVEQSSTVQTSTKPVEESSKPTETSTPTITPQETDIGGIALYQELFSMDSTVQVSLTVAQSELDKLQSDYNKYKNMGSKSPIYRKATLTLTVNGTTYTLDEVGIRLKGNMWLAPVYDKKGKLNISHYKLSFNETFDDSTYYGAEAKKWASDEERKARKKRRLATLKEMDTKWNICYDETFVREIYAADLCREQGILVQQIGLAQMNFNGKNYGIVKIYEPVDDIFLEKRLPEAALGGDLYKCGWTMRPCNYVQNEVTYGVEDKDKALKYNFNLKTNKKKSDHSALKNLLKVMAGNPSKADFEKIVDADYFAKFLAVSYFLGDPDDIRNNYNNHYIYFRKDTGKAVFIVYDNDRTLGITYGYNPDGTGMTGQQPFYDKAVGAGGSQRNPLIRSAILNSNAYCKTQYTSALQTIAASRFWQEDVFLTYYEKAKNHYAAFVQPDVNFANVKQSFRFSLDGKYPAGDKANMSFTEYVTRIMKTYHTAMGG